MATSGEDSVCIICKISDERQTSKVGEKGCQGLKAASKVRGDQLAVVPGQVVHPDCRRLYCHPNIQRLEKDVTPKLSTPKTRSISGEKFDFKTKCLFCEKDAKFKQNKREEDVWPISTMPFLDTIKEICKTRNDEWGNKVLGLIEYARDLPAVEARYHQTCSSNFRSGYQIPKRHDSGEETLYAKKGRPSRPNVEQAFLQTIQFFEENERNQMTISDLVTKMSEICGEEAYSAVYMKKKILEYFGDSIVITELEGRHNVVTFKDTADAILETFYHRSGKGDKESEAKSIIKTAAKLILRDIKNIELNTKLYPSYDEILSLESNLDCVPENLIYFLKHIIDNKTSQRKIASIGQAIVQASAPRKVIQPLQLGLGVQLHHHFGSRFLLDTLNSLGFCSSYKEVQRFERSAATAHGTEICLTDDHFVQFSADNVDHNTNTLDGHNTFHGMGIIAAVTPKLKQKRVIQRIKATNEDLIAIGKIEIQYYKQETNNMETLLFKALKNVSDVSDNMQVYENLDLALTVSRPLRFATRSWSGVMQMVHSGEFPGQSSVFFMPMIDMNPSDMTCIYSTLKFVVKQCRRMQTPVVTFDQPLYWKALSIVINEPAGSELKRVVVRLGAFHTEMSYLGSIGKIMENTGLSELLATVYAPNTVGNMLSGKAVSRAVRGHLLISDAVKTILLYKSVPNANEEDVAEEGLESTDINNNIEADVTFVKEDNESLSREYKTVETVFSKLLDGEISVENLISDESVTKIKRMYETTIVSLQQNRTAKLWLQYLEMINILKKFIAAERTGDWGGHLSAIQEMLPFFAAAGHNLYLKSVYVYLQEMAGLNENSPDVYQAFLNGNHVIRRSDRYWGGLSSDLVIEQVLMRSVKSVGGMTRGRGMTESQRAQWLLSMPACIEMNNSMQEFTGQRYETSDQHKESADARIVRDNKDRKVFEDFLRERNPFTDEPSLRNIETGAVAEPNVNVDNAKSVGHRILHEMEGRNIIDYSFKRTNQAVTMGSKGNLKIGDEEISIDPQLLFQRLIAVSDDSFDDPEEVFKFELCSHPSALFDSSGLLREAQKPALATAIRELDNCGADKNIGNSVIYVLDGGSLLQRLPWTFGTSFHQICSDYAIFVEKNYGKAYVVFDGYQNGPSIKDVTHHRRTRGIQGTKINFNEKTPFKTKKDVFLSNSENKQNFIDLLGKYLAEQGCTVLNAPDDADLLIVQTAVRLSEDTATVAVGEDTDLLILLLYHSKETCKSIYLKSDVKVNLKKKIIWDITKTKRVIGQEIARLLPFLHAFTGCDSNSRIFGIGKGAAFKKLISINELRVCGDVFIEESTHANVEAAGERAFVILYNGAHESLDQLRYKTFLRKVNVGKAVVQVQTLPPTRSAAKYHSMRTYLQVQTWLGREMNATEWGWCRVDSALIPLKTDLPAAPERLLKIIRCSCKVNCDTKRCSCRKHGLSCSAGCGECKGTSCSNIRIMDDEEEETDDTEA